MSPFASYGGPGIIASYSCRSGTFYCLDRSARAIVAHSKWLYQPGACHTRREDVTGFAAVHGATYAHSLSKPDLSAFHLGGHA